MATEVTETDLNRRNLLRGGAVLAGAAGIAALGAVGAPTASAADGLPVLQGEDQSATDTTALRIDEPGGGEDPTLALYNADGPSLFLQPLAFDWPGDLQLGEIANTEIGPSIGLEDFEGDLTVGYLATNFDLGALPLAVAITPQRLADTRTVAGREGIVRSSSSSALDSSNRLTAGSWIDIAVAAADGPNTVDSVFVNLTVVDSQRAGYITAYPPGGRPATSTVNFAKGQIVANGAFIQTGVFETTFVIRVFAHDTTHVVVDLTGVTISEVPGPAGTLQAAKKTAQKRRKARAAKRPLPAFGRRR